MPAGQEKHMLILPSGDPELSRKDRGNDDRAILLHVDVPNTRHDQASSTEHNTFKEREKKKRKKEKKKRGKKKKERERKKERKETKGETESERNWRRRTFLPG